MTKKHRSERWGSTDEQYAGSNEFNIGFQLRTLRHTFSYLIVLLIPSPLIFLVECSFFSRSAQINLPFFAIIHCTVVLFSLCLIVSLLLLFLFYVHLPL